MSLCHCTEVNLGGFLVVCGKNYEWARVTSWTSLKWDYASMAVKLLLNTYTPCWPKVVVVQWIFATWHRISVTWKYIWWGWFNSRWIRFLLLSKSASCRCRGDLAGLTSSAGHTASSSRSATSSSTVGAPAMGTNFPPRRNASAHAAIWVSISIDQNLCWIFVMHCHYWLLMTWK